MEDYKFDVEEDEDIELDSQINDTGSIIFLIDCRRSLFEQKVKSTNAPKEISWFEAIIESCISVAKNKALNFGKDTLSVVFFRVNKVTDTIMKNVFVFLELNTVSVENIHKLIKLKSLSADDFEKQYGFSTEVSLLQGLLCCQHIFGKWKRNLDSKQILLFTDDDNPHGLDDDVKRRILVKAHDLMQTDTHIELIPIAQGFNVDKFYKELLLINSRDTDDDTFLTNNPISVIEELTARVRHKQYKKRRLAHVNWQLGSDQLVISVGIYSLVRKTPAPRSVLLHRDTNTEVTSTSGTYLKQSGALLMPFDMKLCLTIAGKTICFEPEEIKRIRSIIDPGIRLLGFKPMNYLKRHYQVRASQFIYPDETSIKGSCNLFSALLIRCSERSVFALCVYLPRKGSPVQFVALVPQLEKLNDSGLQIRPPGFHVVFLPFTEDIRRLDLAASTTVSDDDMDVCKSLIKSLDLEYDPERILNPSLQKKLIYIEALALGSEVADNFEDHTIINNDEVNKQCGDTLLKFKDHFMLGMQSPKQKKTIGKGTVDLETAHKSDALKKLTVAELKAGAKDLGIKLYGTKKDEFVASIKDYFNKRGV